MFKIKVSKSNISKVEKVAITNVNKYKSNVWEALKAARDDAIEEAKLEIEELFTEHEGRHPDAERRGIEHFEFKKNQVLSGNNILVGVDVEPADEVGLFLMSGTQPHTIHSSGPHMLLVFEFTHGGMYIGEKAEHPGIESRVDEVEEIMSRTLLEKTVQYLGSPGRLSGGL